jgi:hypothetical protein
MLIGKWLAVSPSHLRRLPPYLILGFFPLLCLLNSCPILASPAPSPPKVPCQPDADDRAVYTAVLQDPDVWHLPVNTISVQPFTLAPRKDEWDKPDRPFGTVGQNSLHAASEQTRADFAAKTTSGCLIGKLPQKDLERASAPQPGRDNPADRDRRTQRTHYWDGRITLSRVGFNAARNEAIVYAESDCGNSCGGGDLFLLRRVDGAWTIVNEVNLWEL